MHIVVVLHSRPRKNVLGLRSTFYNAKPLKLNIRDPYIPDKTSDRTPEWQKTAKYDAKLFGRLGSVSGIEPSSLWPSHDQLNKSSQRRETREKEQTRSGLITSSLHLHPREKLIAANMAKMPKMVAEWRRAKREAKRKMKEEKERRTRLLAEARERFGHAVDPRSPKFLEMVAEIEKEEKKKRKLLKRKMREEQVAAGSAPPAAS
uniref:Large ribosomal subunit protein mL64 n=1 Tax=Salarias fasciatus TaxID=181472 RepID=A0A672GHJ0_SALFA